MNSYFFNITNEERSNILDKHKEIYDGYVTEYGKGSNQQPLYVQDYANDKGGITVNNSGEVGVYRNTNINEMRHDGKDTGLFSGEATEDVFSGAKFEPEETFEELDEMELDTIGDGPMDLDHGTVDFEDDGDDYDFVLTKSKDMGVYDEMDEEEVEPLQEQLSRTLDMFKRFKKY